MMGPDHRIAGVVAWFAAVPPLGVHGWPVAAGAVVAGATAHGRLSPDADQFHWLAKVIPGGHRGITHWWVFPLAGIWWATYLIGPYRWELAVISIAWASHIITDAVFGKVPILPKLFKGHGHSRWVYLGLGLKTGGKIEYWVAVPAFILFGLWSVLTILQVHPTLYG
jgi:membrane-bound metal-dependent hydrolase YbcI (DUF457 family)